MDFSPAQNNSFKNHFCNSVTHKEEKEASATPTVPPAGLEEDTFFWDTLSLAMVIHSAECTVTQCCCSPLQAAKDSQK